MFADLRFRLRALFNRRAVEQEMDDELRFHLEREVEKRVAAGVPRHEAERQARIAFGGMDRIREDTRDARGVDRIESLLQDFRYAWRGIVTRPAFASAIVLTLALGIGANTAMFTIVDRLLFRPPSYLADPARVQRVYLTWTTPQGTNTERTIEYTRYLDLTRSTTSFDKTAVLGLRMLPVGDGSDTRDMLVAVTSASFLQLFDMRPALGRFYGDADDHIPIGEPVAVLSNAFWRSHFGGRTDALGSRIHVGTMLLTVIGVAPAGFDGITDDGPPMVFVPVTTLAGSRSKDYYSAYHWSFLDMFVRLKPGVSATTADADLTAAYQRSWRKEGAADRTLGPIEAARPRAAAASLHLSRGPQASADSKVARWVMGIALIVLLVACANVANLLLARAVARRREIGLRVALGVSRGRLLQQLATESLVLAGMGGIAGLLVAQVGGRILRALFIRDEDAAGLALDGRTLGFVALATILVAIVTGVAPLLHTLRSDVNDALKAGGRDSAYRRPRLGTALLVFQGSLSVVMLVGAGLFVRSLVNVRAARLGYDIQPILLVDGNMRDVKLTHAEQNALNRRLLSAAQSAPGVSAATITTSVPFYSNEGRGTPIVPGRDSLAKRQFLLQAGSVDYFKAIGTRILQGRGFETTDRAGTTRVAVVSKDMAEYVWPGESAIGKQFKLETDTSTAYNVVGVAENMTGRQLTQPDELWYYLPIEQYEERWRESYPALFIRVNGRTDDFIEPLRRRLQQVMPGSSYVNVVTLQSIVSRVQQSWQLGATMFLAFGGLALVLAGIGLYSSIAYAVAQRTRELGVRIALGASSGRVVQMIVGQSVVIAVAGIVIGGAIAFKGAEWIEPLLFDESARDPAVFAVVGASLLLASIVAAARPAFRAVRVDPAEVLRSD